MEPDRDPVGPLGGLAMGFAALALRLAAIFAVMGAGYWIYTLFGSGWFHVFVATVIAIRLHLEIKWIESLPEDELSKQLPESMQGRDASSDPLSNPFRKR